MIIGQEVADLLSTITPPFHEAPTITEPAHSGYTTIKLPAIDL
ncbi:MAG TPA: hypothetical protein VL461_12320 [Dictyobacter sp.]|nr:hypothetical protein [Dictyobacter sp.]